MPESAQQPDLASIRSDLIQMLAEISGEALPEISGDTPILDVVVSSLALVEGMRRIYEQFGVLISIRLVIEGQATLDGIAAHIHKELLAPARRGQQLHSDSPRSVPSEQVQARFPVRPLQRQATFLARYSPQAAAAFNEHLALELQGELDALALQSALDTVSQRYEALRTAIGPDQDQLLVYAPAPLGLEVRDCAVDELEARLGEIVGRPFEPQQPFLRAELLRLSPRRNVLVLVSHAVTVEPEALQHLAREIGSLYAAYTRDEDPAEGIPALQWSDYLAIGETAQARGVRRSARAFWETALAERTAKLELPSDRARPSVKGYHGARIVSSLDPALARKLRAWAKAKGWPLQEILLTAYQVYLSRLTGQSSLTLGVRSSSLYEIPGQVAIAPTRTMLPLRLELDDEKGFLEQLASVAERFRSADEQRFLGLAEMVEIADPGRDRSRSPLFEAAFRAGAAVEDLEFGPTLAASPIYAPASGARYDLECIAAIGQQGVDLIWEYSSELFDEDSVRRWAAGLRALLDAALEAPTRPCKTLPLMDASERRKIIRSFNQTQKTIPAEVTTLDLFSQQAADTPSAIAVRCEDEIVSYRELQLRVEAWASELAGRGVEQGDRVGVLVQRSPDMLAALLAVWQVGALYVPLDPGFPPSRLAYLLRDSGARTVIAHRMFAERLRAEANPDLILVETLPAAGNGRAERIAGPGPSDSAYVIYTSGSTGQPKGVEVTHRSLLNCLLDIQDRIEFSAGQSLLAIATVAFDISAVELFVPLISGGVADIAPQDAVADGTRLRELIESHQPDYVQATPTTWKLVLAAGWQGAEGMRIASTGEAISRELAEQLLQRADEVWNLYGPTEATIYAAAWNVESGPDEPVLIGTPLNNTQLYVLDENREPLPVGAVGELYIGGDGLARGYWQRPELTARQFIPDPFGSGARLYRSGDLARLRPDGTVQCLSRIDDQVKIHGVRVELGEVEAALREIEAVADAVAAVWRDEGDDDQLVAHVIASEPELTARDIRAQLRQRLPEVMVPPFILFTDSFPVNPSGKVQRSRLPAPNEAQARRQDPGEPPQTVTERTLAEAWSRVLSVDLSRIGRHSDFMDLGGHSLLMTPLMLEVQDHFQVRFSLSEFFGASTLKELADLIDQRRQSLTTAGLDSSLSRLSRDSAWGRERMSFLTREAELPASIAPARGMQYRPVATISNILLTGATGFLGAYLMAEMLDSTQATIWCLVRPKRGERGRNRIERQLRAFELWNEEPEWQRAWAERVQILEGDVTLPRLGIEDAIYERLARDIDAILHGAAHVNFIYPYEALRATNVLGLHEVIRFAFYQRIKPVHHLSTAAIWPMGAEYTFYEGDPIEHGQALNLGYDEAKWVGERCLLNAEERGLPMARYRPGEVGGDSRTGRCVLDHFLMAAIKGFVQFGAFPRLDVEIDVAPVDYVAQAIVHLVFQRNPLGRAYHLTNPRRSHMREALAYLRSLGYDFVEMPFEQLRTELVASDGFADNALFPYQAMLQEMDTRSFEMPTYDCTQTLRELEGSGIMCPPADRELFDLYMQYLRAVGFIPEPADASSAKVLVSRGSS